jgi:hypothetical protein
VLDRRSRTRTYNQSFMDRRLPPSLEGGGSVQTYVATSPASVAKVQTYTASYKPQLTRS